MPFAELLRLMLIQVVVKTLYEVIALPLTIRVVDFVKKLDDTDTFDSDLDSYNPLKVFDL